MTFFRTMSLLLILCASAFIMPHAHASCSSPDMPHQVALNAAKVSSSLATGALIPGTRSTFTVHGTCSHDDDGLMITACYFGTGAENSRFPGVYDTNVPGIGIMMLNEKGQRIRGAGHNCDTRNAPLGVVASDGSDSFVTNVTLALVKTADHISSGTLQYAQTQFGLGVYGKTLLGSPGTVSYGGNVQLTAVSCTVSSDMTITLGDFPDTAFPRIGTSSSARGFTIDLTCDQSVQPSVMISSANGYESDFPGVIKLTPGDSTATGIGVMLSMNSSSPIFDTWETLPTKTTAGQALGLPFSVRYFQLANTVTPGSANSVFTISFEYN